jgi:hypothetical protein
MDIQMRVLPEDLQTYLKSAGDPLAILKIANLKPGSNWIFNIRLNEQTAPELSIYLPEGISPWEILDGTFPELHWCSEIEVRTQDTVTTIEACTGLILNVRELKGNRNELVLKDFAGKHLNSSWGDSSLIEKYLLKNSWIGVPVRNRPHGTITWIFVSEEYIFDSSKLISKQTLGENTSLQESQFVVDIYERPGGKETTILEKTFGDFSSRPEFKPMMEAIRRKGLSGALLVLANGWQFDVGPFGVVRSLERTENTIQSLKIKIIDSTVLNSWIDRRKQRKEIGEAARLDLRRESAKNAPRVFYNDRCIGTVPTSEAGASAIFHKLEVLGGIPFPRFSTLAWASSDGIDAIADIQFDLNEPMGHLLPIEYEFKFENFLTHQHPHGHVHLVVCWYKSDLLTKTDKAWLYLYKDAKFKVLVISEVPGLKIVTKK